MMQTNAQHSLFHSCIYKRLEEHLQLIQRLMKILQLTFPTTNFPITATGMRPLQLALTEIFTQLQNS